MRSVTRCSVLTVLIVVILSAGAVQAQTCQAKKENTVKKARCEGPVKCDKDEAKEAAKIACADQKCTGEHNPECPTTGKCDTGQSCLPYIYHEPLTKDVKEVEARGCERNKGYKVTLEGDLTCKCKCRVPRS